MLTHAKTPERPLRAMTKRVTMADVDAAGILYFASPYRWLEEHVTGWLIDCHHPLSELLKGGYAFPCVSSSASYSAPVRVDDILNVTLHPLHIGRTSFAVGARCQRADGAHVVSVAAWHVWVEFGESPLSMPLPPWLRNGLEQAPIIDLPVPSAAPQGQW